VIKEETGRTNGRMYQGKNEQKEERTEGRISKRKYVQKEE